MLTLLSGAGTGALRMIIPTQPFGSISRPFDLSTVVMVGDETIGNSIELSKAAGSLVIERLGTAHDSGFSPFCDELFITRATPFANIPAPAANLLQRRR